MKAIRRLTAFLVKPTISSLLLGLGALTNSPRLIRKASQLDPDNTKAHQQALLAFGFDWHRINRFLLAPKFAEQMGIRSFDFIESNFSESKAQLFQDLFVLITLEQKRQGYFVEIGVGNGEYLSNTWILEKKYGWHGLLVEANRDFCRAIRNSRSALIDDRAVWRTSGERLEFLSVASCMELSTIKTFQDSDQYARAGETYPVSTISLNDLLAAHDAPDSIDYMSIDTEGSEWEILENFDFKKYRVSIFTIEHNFSIEKLNKISSLLIRNGYSRVHSGFSRFDAWFVSNSLQGTAFS